MQLTIQLLLLTLVVLGTATTNVYSRATGPTGEQQPSIADGRSIRAARAALPDGTNGQKQTGLYTGVRFGISCTADEDCGALGFCIGGFCT